MSPSGPREARRRALVLAPALYVSEHAKTAHGLVRGSERFQVVGVLDPTCARQDAGTLLDGHARGIPVVDSLEEALALQPPPETVIVGIAVAGGRLPPALRALLRAAAERGLDIVNGLHDFAGDDPAIAAAAATSGATIVDVRRDRPRSTLHFWTGAIARVRAPRIAVLGTDCALGKRTTARLLVESCRAGGMRAEMIHTGQTGWMQGGRFGFVLDSTPNDFVSGELEHACVTCDEEARPDVMILEGQSALRNPSGPCGAELLLSAQARAVILQHAPARTHYKGHGDDDAWRIPPIDEEVALVGAYGARVLAVTLNTEHLDERAARAAARELEARLGLPVVLPLADGMAGLVPLVRAHIERERR